MIEYLVLLAVGGVVLARVLVNGWPAWRAVLVALFVMFVVYAVWTYGLGSPL